MPCPLDRQRVIEVDGHVNEPADVGTESVSAAGLYGVG